MYVPAEIYHRFRTKPSPKPAHGLCLSLLDGHLIVLQGIRNPSICELGPRLLACAEYFACCSNASTPSSLKLRPSAASPGLQVPEAQSAEVVAERPELLKSSRSQVGSLESAQKGQSGLQGDSMAVSINLVRVSFFGSL